MDNVSVYKLTCLTDLHMGSGDVQFGVVDLEVQRDAVTGEPTMFSSGVKGALRDFCRERVDKDAITAIFGSDDNGDTPGSYRFLSGDLLARPVRVSSGKKAYALATAPELIGLLLKKLAAFGQAEVLGADTALPAFPEDGSWLCGNEDIKAVEGYGTRKAACPLLNSLLGTDWVLMPLAALNEIDLPVVAHNVLNDKGISKNLWYEQDVPHESVFLLLIVRPGEADELEKILGEKPVVQFGANASTGLGFVQLERLKKAGGENG